MKREMKKIYLPVLWILVLIMTTITTGAEAGAEAMKSYEQEMNVTNEREKEENTPGYTQNDTNVEIKTTGEGNDEVEYATELQRGFADGDSYRKCQFKELRERLKESIRQHINSLEGRYPGPAKYIEGTRLGAQEQPPWPM